MMEAKKGPKRCLFMHSWYTDPISLEGKPYLASIAKTLDHMREAEKFLEKRQYIDYSVILPQRLLDEKIYSVKGTDSTKINRPGYNIRM